MLYCFTVQGIYCVSFQDLKRYIPSNSNMKFLTVLYLLYSIVSKVNYAICNSHSISNIQRYVDLH